MYSLSRMPNDHRHRLPLDRPGSPRLRLSLSALPSLKREATRITVLFGWLPPERSPSLDSVMSWS